MKTLPKNGDIPHFNAGIMFCCKNPKADWADEKIVERTKKRMVVDCINCRGQFVLSYTKLIDDIGVLHISRLCI